jgi:hypothetical protein
MPQIGWFNGKKCNCDNSFLPKHNHAFTVITVFKWFFTVGTIVDDVTDAVVGRACTLANSVLVTRKRKL